MRSGESGREKERERRRREREKTLLCREMKDEDNEKRMRGRVVDAR